MSLHQWAFFIVLRFQPNAISKCLTSKQDVTMKSNIISKILFVLAALAFMQCHEAQSVSEEGNIVGRWEWIRSESTFPPGTVLTPQSEGYTETFIFEPDSVFQQLVNGQTQASGKFQLIDYGMEEGVHFYGLIFDTQQEMEWSSTSLRWIDASTIMMDYSPLDGPHRYFKRKQHQDTER